MGGLAARMFYLSYIASELRRRRGRTFLTALGLGVGVALVVCVAALSDGLDQAQDEVLEPLTGVGTDLSVARPLEVEDGQLSERERQQLEEENGAARLGLQNREPGERFEQTNFVSSTQLSFPQSETRDVSDLPGAAAVAGGLTLSAVHVSGRVPEQTGGPRIFRGPGGPRSIDLESSTVSGVDQRQEALGAVTAGQVSQGRYFSSGDAREAILNVSYARRNGIEIGERITLKGERFEVVGLASPPLGGQASDSYVKLDQLQPLADREGRVNTLYVRAASSDQVAALTSEIERSFPGSEVTTSQDLADRVGGSLEDARDLSGKLGAALTVVGLLAAFLIASLLTLSSVTKRIRELGTLKALGWPQRLVVRQVAGESLAQGALGGLAGAALGVLGGVLISALGIELEATVAEASEPSGPRVAGPGMGPPGGGFGQGAVTAGSELVKLDAPVDVRLILIAVGLALLGGLVAGMAGGARAARLRPADALRHID
jgi:ABC-type antimicrobial peptide transport system permease subunit